MREERMKEESVISRIDVRSILMDVRQNIWVIILAVFTGFFITNGVSSVICKPVYTCEATFVVNAKSSSNSIYNNLSTATYMADVFTEIFTSEAMEQKVCEVAGMENFNGTIKASLISDTNLMEVSVSSDSPEHAFREMQAIVNNYHEITDYVYNNAVLSVLKAPEINETPSNQAQIDRLPFIGGIAFGLLIAGIIILLSYLRDTVKNEKDFEDKVDGDKIAVLVHEEKYIKGKKIKNNATKKSILITNQTTSFGYRENINSLGIKLQHIKDSRDCKTIMITSVAENEGKSTVAANIALALAARGEKVLLLDADFRKPALYKVFDIDPEKQPQIIELVKTGRDLNKYLRYDKKKKLYELFGTKSTTNSSELIVSENMTKLLKALRKQLDFVIIDTPPIYAASDAEAMADITDASLLVVRQDRAFAGEINDAIDTLKQAKAEFIGCIFNDVKVLNYPGQSVTAQTGRYGYGYGSGYGRTSSSTGRTSGAERSGFGSRNTKGQEG